MKKEVALLVAILILAAWLRLYRLNTLYTFLGDQGRDALIVRDIILLKNFPFVGPTASVGVFYLGPFYYYLIAPALLFACFNPIGPAVFIALLGVATVAILFWFVRRHVSAPAGVIAAGLYALSSIIVGQARFSWNPNPLPLFTLLMWGSLLEWIRTQKDKYYYGFVAWLVLMWQLHYLSLVLVPAVMVFMIAGKIKIGWKKAGISFGLAAGSFIPVVLFDLKHGWVNVRGLVSYFWQQTGRTDAPGIALNRLLSYTFDRFRIIHSEFFQVKDYSALHLTVLVVSLAALMISFRRWFKKRNQFGLAILSWTVVGLAVLSFFQGTLHAYYLLVLLPLPAILTAIAFDFFRLHSKITAWLFAAGWLATCGYFLSQNWIALNRKGNLNIPTIRQAVEYIQQQSAAQPFNFALLATHNYDSSYRYFFELKKMPAEYTDTVTGQLFVVCEELDNCRPEGNPKWEIALFDAYYHGKIKKTDERLINHAVKIFRFVPSE